MEVCVLCLFLTVSWVGLWSVIVALPGETHLYFGTLKYLMICMAHTNAFILEQLQRLMIYNIDTMILQLVFDLISV